MFFRYLLLIYLLGCSPPKEIQKTTSDEHTATIKFAVWVEYSKSVPDSVRDFMKVYFQTKQINVIGMKEAIEMIVRPINEILLNKIQSGSISSEKEITAIAQQYLKQQVCSNLNIRLFPEEKIEALMIDSIKWDVIPKPSGDTTLKPKVNTYYPNPKNKENVFLEWRSFADAILSSGLLK
jgi:hypothetical protein